MQRFANPARFMRLADAVLPWAAGVAAAGVAAGLVLALVASPPDYQQGDSVRIMYVHVPAAWCALLVYATMAALSVAGLVWRHPLADLTAQCCAPIGACFTIVALATGSLWGKPMWGTWWVWDARLTSVVILLLLYLGHMALTAAFDDPVRGARAGALLAIVGAINLPIIKFSVEWWHTLHQPASVLRLDGPTIASSMLVPLLVMAVAFTALFVCVLLLRVKAALIERRLGALRQRAAGVVGEAA